jgi:uncharacterized repeat protein (TIGR02543 family)
MNIHDDYWWAGYDGGRRPSSFYARVYGNESNSVQQEYLKELVSPIAYLTSTSPGLYLAHGNMDTTIPHTHVYGMRDQAVAVGHSDFSYLIVENASHNFGSPTEDPLIPDTTVIGAETTSKLLGYLELNPINPIFNVALNGTASQSSTDFDGDPERAIDGNTNGDYNGGLSVTHTAFEDQPWWQVDLGDPYAIDEIQVWGRTGIHAGRLSNYDVYILDCRNNVVWSNYQASYPDPSVSLDPGGVRGRFVKIQLQATNQALSLAEVRVFSDTPAGYCGDLTLDGKVNLEDVAELSGGWQSAYSMGTLLDIAEDWLSRSEYQLTVNNGSGSGDYMPGTVVSVAADTAPTGYGFAGWTGDVTYVTDAGAATTTVTMPAENVDLTATYQEVLETDIVWQSAVAISSASDVSTDGILVEAVNACGSEIAASGFTENPTVNGVQFMATPDLLDEDHSISDFCTSLAAGDYDQLLSTLDFAGSSTTMTVGGGSLEVGSRYQIQLWYVDQRGDKESRRMTFDDGKGNFSEPINGHYVIGEFTADGTTQDIAITGIGTDDPHINAYQIRKLSE